METDYTKTLIFISGYLYFILQCKKASLGVIQSYSSLLLQVRTRAMISSRLSKCKPPFAVILILGRYSYERAVFTSLETALQK